VLLNWYAGNDPRRRTKAYFNNIMTHTQTYYGENYGHSGAEAHQLGIGEICFETPADSVGVVIRGNQPRIKLRKPQTDR